MENKLNIYNIGLDIGTNSVGWSVTDEYNNLIKFRKHNMWGVRLFEQGDTAATTRIKRSTRRRYARRKERICFLRELTNNMIIDIDENFFARMDEGFLQTEERSLEREYTLFEDAMFTDKDYYKKHPTIYHLRNELVNADYKADPRLIYLALHHIVKYRGHFLYEGQKFDSIVSDSSEILLELQRLYQDILNTDLGIDKMLAKEIDGILKNKNITKKGKQEYIVDKFVMRGIEKKLISEIVKAIMGYKADTTILFFDNSLHDETDKILKISFSESNFEELEEILENKLQDRYVLLEELKKIYSYMVLQEILAGNETISGAMIVKYNKHKSDLETLKRIIKLYAKDSYSLFFREKLDSNKKNLKNYANYIKGEKSCTQEELYKTIHNILNKVPVEECEQIFADIEEKKFLPLLNSKENSLIPYQLNENELNQILEKQSLYYEELAVNKEKIKVLFKFKIPYYIGPLNSNSKFSWLVRGEEKITPWNYKEVINIEETAEKFITRMTNYCTYLPEEKVIPQYSLLYSRYQLLNELNKIRINGKLIQDQQIKNQIVTELFYNPKNKIVSDKKFTTYLKSILYTNESEYEITGYQKENGFASTMTSYIDFTKIFGKIDASNEAMIEKLILWLTIYEERDIIRTKVKTIFPDRITDKQMNQILKLRYKGWSRLSEKLLTYIKTDNKYGQRVNIMYILENTNLNLMQIISDKELGYKQKIEQYTSNKTGDQIELDDIKKLQGSPAIKRGIWQTVKIVNEIIEIMGREPKNIFIEFAREDDEKKRSLSRVNKLTSCYEKLKEDTDEYDRRIANELKSSKSLDNEKLFLYFIQNGKCMYSGEPLDIDKLYTYQVDHIIPQAYIKDDSIENKVLVKVIENQYKTDKLLLSTKVQRERKDLWYKLYHCGLMGAKKYKNLNRVSIDEFEAKGFINRQLVETRQISKQVAILLKDSYTNTNIVTIKAQLSHDFRDKYGLYKNREINDYHHAHDAYLASMIGNYLLRIFPGLESELIYDEFKMYYKDFASNRANKYGFLIAMFDKKKINEEGIICWNGSEEIEKVKKALMYKDCRVTKKLEVLTGAYYNETIYGRNEKEAKIPLKKGLDPQKYGGYSGQQIAYSLIVQYVNKKKLCKKLIGIPIYIDARRGVDEEVIKTYIKEQIQCDEIQILKDNIMKYQLIEEGGKLLYLVSDKEVINAKQLCFEKDGYKFMKLMEIAFNNPKEEGEELIREELEDFYKYLINKIKTQYVIFSNVLERIDTEIIFNSLSFEDQIYLVKEILKLLRADSANANLKRFKLSDRVGRKSGYTLNIDETMFIDQSITGLYERRYRI